MFDYPRSGKDRRAAKAGADNPPDGEKRKQADRRVFCEPRHSGPWWVMRGYVRAEKFILDQGSE